MVNPIKKAVQKVYKSLKKNKLENSEGVYNEWAKEKEGSVDFFEKKLHKGSMDKRLNSKAKLRKDVRGYLPKDQKELKLLDVGAGPITRLGYNWEDRIIHIEAVDVNGDLYQKLFKKHNITPPVITKNSEAEKIHELYEGETFDFAFSRNALDHCYDPIKGIKNMVDLIKPQRYAVLLHRRNEGLSQGYRGAHLWNFDVEQDQVIVYNPSKKYKLREELSGVEVQYKLEQTPKDEWIYVEIFKK
ncbi:methyltransferase domain-containing protein [Isachenkonia alkalipeptolytica]|uniref:Class I SAM-dependent methyltransferase n=1 Tax=Isachenkonia alkalipeptolytica TaxID=2565777 RepID=A0AA44BDX1_9CLOT|nr:methyltransferase domain-containing protein [Isachenkonia alkalipeptolytica]NBG88392.1 class I SAM-dependent methyltransferase [Isachenkonia alkalipeptolytica]